MASLRSELKSATKDAGDDLPEPLLHRHLPELRGSLGHLALGAAPSLLRRLPPLQQGGAEVWLKDDGAYGEGGWGGNKVRKLEWLLPEARRRGARTLLTVGGLGTNWGLAAALYGRANDLDVVLALVDQPLDEHVEAQLERLHASGATIYRTRTKARTIAVAPWLIARHSNGRRLPYFLPAGGSSPLGSLGYVEAGEMPEPSHAVVALGSGGTTAGLALGLRLAGLRTQVVGVVVSDLLRLDAPRVARLARRTARLLRRRGARPPAEASLSDSDLTSVRDWLGPGYGHPTPEARRAAELARERWSLSLDPVYTAKAVAALLEMNSAGRFGEGPVLYVHTDGPRGLDR